MKKLLVILTVMIVFSFVNVAYAAELKGKIVSLNDVMAGKDKVLSVADATKLYEKGFPLAFKSGEKVYFVYSTSGVYAGKRLVKKVGKDVTIKGKVKNKGGIQYIIMDSIK
jgi:hypothetical protein